MVARELGVNYLLVGKIRWQRAAGLGSVEVSPELIDLSASGEPTTRWQQSFHAGLDDVFQVQAEIAGQVAQALNVALGARDRQQLEARPTANPAAYESTCAAMRRSPVAPEPSKPCKEPRATSSGRWPRTPRSS